MAFGSSSGKITGRFKRSTETAKLERLHSFPKAVGDRMIGDSIELYSNISVSGLQKADLYKHMMALVKHFWKEQMLCEALQIV